MPEIETSVTETEIMIVTGDGDVVPGEMGDHSIVLRSPRMEGAPSKMPQTVAVR